MGVSGEQERSVDWGCNNQMVRVGSGGAIAPDLPEGIDGCGESEVSREWLTGDTVYWLSHGLNAHTEPPRGGCNGGAQRSPCQDGNGVKKFKFLNFVLQYTSCATNRDFNTGDVCS